MAKYTMQLNLTPTAQALVDQLRARTQMPNTKMVERLLQWLVEQDELVQLRVLGIMTAESAGELSRLVLEQMAAEAEDEPRPARAAKRAKPEAKRGVGGGGPPPEQKGRRAS